VNIDIYFEQTEAEIVADICALKVPTEILLDQDGWNMLNAVRGRNKADVNGDTWSEICRIRSQLSDL
jgi:hypothetical protein